MAACTEATIDLCKSYKRVDLRDSASNAHTQVQTCPHHHGRTHGLMSLERLSSNSRIFLVIWCPWNVVDIKEGYTFTTKIAHGETRRWHGGHEAVQNKVA